MDREIFNKIRIYLNYLEKYKLPKDKKSLDKMSNFSSRINMSGGGEQLNETLKILANKIELAKGMGNNSDTYTQNITNLLTKINELQDKIKRINIDDVNINRVSGNQNIEKEIVRIASNNDYKDVGTYERSDYYNYYTYQPLDLGDFHSKSYGTNILKALTSQIENQKKLSGEEYERHERSINENIATISKKIDDLTKKINDEIIKMDSEILTNNDSLKFDQPQQGDISIRDKLGDENTTVIIYNAFLRSQEIAGGQLVIMNNLVDNIANKPLPKTKNNKIKGGANAEVLSISLTNLYNLIDKYEKKIDEYNQMNMRLTEHIRYLLDIATNKLFLNNSIYVYRFISRSLLVYYQRILNTLINDIMEKRKTLGESTVLVDIDYDRDYFTLHKLKNFLDYVINSKTVKLPTQYIDINECKNEALNRLILLNNYKGKLEKFQALALNNITIYARINNIGNNIIKFFKSNADDTNIAASAIKYDEMSIDKSRCLAIESKKNDQEFKKKYEKINGDIKFTEVFNYEDFEDNNSLETYMNLHESLVKSESKDIKNGIILMTYGYSGTGKTYTLFGNKAKTGILQTTLNKITNLENVYFRLYEIYGYGLAYPHYWEDMNTVSQEILRYDLVVENMNLKFKGVSQERSPQAIETYIRQYNSDINLNEKNTYTKIENKNIEEIFKNFTQFTDSVDSFRQGTSNIQIPEEYKKRRIRDTTNNVVSSRSILVYDFVIEYKNNLGEKQQTPFIIIDLPGREDIISTYIKPYFAREMGTIQTIYKYGRKSLGNPISDADCISEFNKMELLFTYAALNPIGISIFVPELVFDFINKIPNLGNIINAKLPMKFIFDIDAYRFMATDKTSADNDIRQFQNMANGEKKTISLKRTTILVERKENTFYIIGTNTGENFTFYEEVINYTGGNIGLICDANSQNKLVITSDLVQLYGYESAKNTKVGKYQYKSLACINFINRLMLMKRFDIIYELYKVVYGEMINKYLIEGVRVLNRNFVSNPQQSIKLNDENDLAKSSKEVLDNLMNKYNFKKEFIMQKINEQQKNGPIDYGKVLEEIIVNDYYLTPFEGIYINENISGLIKFLSSDKTLIKFKGDNQQQKDNNYKATIERLRNNMEQDKTLNFQYQQKNIRIELMDINVGDILGGKPKSIGDIATFFAIKNLDDPNNILSQKFIQLDQGGNNFNNELARATSSSGEIIQTQNKFTDKIFDTIPRPLLKINNDEVKFNNQNILYEYVKQKNKYISSKIFNFDKPIMETIIQPYLKDVGNFKILYLFGNYDEYNTNLKCSHQYELLNNTIDFINNINTSQQ